MFLLVIDVLQRLIKAYDNIRHSQMEGSCLVLQYANDMIILIRGDPRDAAWLKHTLDLFSVATGFTINFGKSTVTPMHIQREAFLDMM